VRGARPLSQAIAEGDGISAPVEVEEAAGAAAAREQGAVGLVVRRAGAGTVLRNGVRLPVLAVAPEPADVDALMVEVPERGDTVGGVVAATRARGLERVLRVLDEDELEEVAGVDAAIVSGSDVESPVGDAPPEV